MEIEDTDVKETDELEKSPQEMEKKSDKDLVAGELKPPGEEDEVETNMEVRHVSGDTRMVTFKSKEEEVTVLEENEDDDEEDCGSFALAQDANKPAIPKAKLLQFHENQRPAYWGTWTKKSDFVSGRKPFGQDKDRFDYEYDSDEEWEEEPEGESLSDNEEDKDEEKEGGEDEYEVDNDFFVPHGYLSDEENERGEDEVFDPEKEKEKFKTVEVERDGLKKKVKDSEIKIEVLNKKQKDDQTRDQHVKELESALEEALVEREQILAACDKEIEDERNIAIELEQKMMEDFEWKLREVEQGYKTKIKDLEESIETRVRQTEREIGREKDAELTKMCIDARRDMEDKLKAVTEAVHLREVVAQLQPEVVSPGGAAHRQEEGEPRRGRAQEGAQEGQAPAQAVRGKDQEHRGGTQDGRQ